MNVLAFQIGSQDILSSLYLAVESKLTGNMWYTGLPLQQITQLLIGILEIKGHLYHAPTCIPWDKDLGFTHLCDAW